MAASCTAALHSQTEAVEVKSVGVVPSIKKEMKQIQTIALRHGRRALMRERKPAGQGGDRRGR